MARLIIEKTGQGQKVLQGLYTDMERRIAASPLGLCPVDMLLNFLRTAHAQSCGKCVPCRVGLGQVEKMIRSVIYGEAGEDILERIEDACTVIRDTADCAIGYETAELVLRGLHGFRDDFLEHIREGRCAYGIEQSIPCTAACPAHIDVPGYIALIKAGRYEDAVRLIRKDNPFPAACGYVCEHPCEISCRRAIVDAPINICSLKRYAVDHAGDIPAPPKADPTGKKVAVVGGGPGGLTAAYYLTLMGHKVTVYEQRAKLGGMMRYGIPNYRLPEDVLDSDINYILKTGVEAWVNINVGTDVSVDELKRDYDAVYLSIGAHDHRKLGIEGEDGENVVSAVEMLRGVGEGEIPDMKGKRVVVVGGGNVAMDATRTSLRLGAARVTTVYRRRIEDMTALPEEVSEAQTEGARILPLYAPHHIELDDAGKVVAFWAQPQIISTVDRGGRTGVRPSSAKPVRIPCDYVVVAIGQSIHSKPFEESGMKTNRGAIDAELSSFVPGSGNVFAGGDAVSGPATVILAVAAGKVAADNIDSFLGFQHTITVLVDVPQPEMTNTPPCGRVNLRSREIDNIAGDFRLVTEGMTDEEAFQECSRCLRCDRFGNGLFRGGRSLEW
ncbi:NADPH-dependent glutamate synthase beta chain [Lachnospiraceae bacterium NK3A20]|nr:NADPH-dependent glutamate synthase beta chain [Lachnospiraceae bacterium NK3A20]